MESSVRNVEEKRKRKKTMGEK